MLKKLYAHNFKCLQNFEFSPKGLNSVLLLGNNGSGKTTIFDALEIFQKIGYGVTSLRDLVNEKHWWQKNIRLPMTLEIELELEGDLFSYKLMIEWPLKFKEPRIKQEILTVNAKEILNRNEGQITFNASAIFLIDWHQVGLPLISTSEDNPVALLRQWLRNIVILSPFPRYFSGRSKQETEFLKREGENCIDWARSIIPNNPEVYPDVLDFLKTRINDLEAFKWEKLGKEERGLEFTFKHDSKTITFNYEELSDGEKMFFLSACLLAAQKTNGSMLCLWDEPDNYIGLTELKRLISDFRQAFDKNNQNSQLIVTSHNESVINEFSEHNTFFISKESHLSHSRIAILMEKRYQSRTVADAYYNGELDE
jgi:ABC-type cobalamin/Fe3+-siderophores transport system ATPase subunit